jgi:cobyrinic acid a,c-diamide synthase
MKVIIVAGTSSGSGKTTVSLGLMGTLRRRGFKVQPFKTGPDYIDPSYHTSITGEYSRNLDTWMLPKTAVLELFHRAMSGKDIAVVEGVMGLFDGHSAKEEEGSTAELAKLLQAPVLLVLDSRRGARSLAATVSGFKSFDTDVIICGVILNGIGSERHLELCNESIEYYTGVPVLGYLPRQDELSLPERHLGLVPSVENPAGREFFDRLTAQCDSTFKIPEILEAAGMAKTPSIEPHLFPAKNIKPIAQIAVAQDRAFSFYYQDSLDLLEAMGAQIVPFSPLEDTKLPAGTSGIYIGGGFPELYAEELTANYSIRQIIGEAVEKAIPLYAECGGLMYLGRSIRDFQGNEHAMVGSIPISSRIDNHRLSLGYRTVKALQDGPLLKEGQVVRGHEFHWSVLDSDSVPANAYAVVDKGEMKEGYQRKGTLASYIHLHMAGSPHMAQRFIENCRKFRTKR